MKIAIVGPAYPYRGGIAAFNERLAMQFLSEGHEVCIYTFTLQYPNFLFPGKTQYSTSKASQGLNIVRCVNSVNPINWLKVGRRIAKEQYDLVIFAYWMSFFAPCYASISKRCKTTFCIGLIHNMIPHESSVMDKLLPPSFIKRMDGLVTLSKSVLEDVKTLDKHCRPAVFLPHPIYDHYGDREPRELALEHLGLDKAYRYMLFFGLVRGYKGLDWLLEAFADERLKNYPIRLIVAGEFYDDKKPYLDQIASLNLGDRVVIDDRFVPDEEVKDYFNAADIVVQPYKSATQSGVTQIAYHFEKPILVTRVGGLEEIVPDGKVGYAVNPAAKSVADALVDFFGNERYDEFKNNILLEKEKYSWSKLTSAMLKMI